MKNPILTFFGDFCFSALLRQRPWSVGGQECDRGGAGTAATTAENSNDGTQWYCSQLIFFNYFLIEFFPRTKLRLSQTLAQPFAIASVICIASLTF